MKILVKVVFVMVLLFSLFSFENKSSAMGNFKDVSRTYWAYEEINYLSGKGVISGYSNGTFKPEAVVTRAQAAIMLVRSLNLSLKNQPNPGYQDVSTNHGAYKYIAAIVDEGIYPKGKKYNPDAPLSREEMARMLVNAYALKGLKNITYKDVSKSYWAQPYISLASENGIAAGYSNGTYRPTNDVTRSQFAVFMSRSMDDRFKVMAPTKTTPILMKDIKLGMTIQQVRNRETRALIDDFGGSNLWKLTYDTQKYGYDVELGYYFDNNQLTLITYDFLPYGPFYHSTNEMYAIFDIIHNEAVREFGNNFSYFEETYPYNEFATLWDKGSYVVMWQVNDEELETSAFLIYGDVSATTASNNNSNQVTYLKEILEKLNN